jgi:hypothetical protein
MHRWRRTPLRPLHRNGFLFQADCKAKAVTFANEGPTSSTDGHDLVKE